jgi:hypothetical protein
MLRDAGAGILTDAELRELHIALRRQQRHSDDTNGTVA